MTIKGIVISVDWDNNGNAVAVAISTHGEEEYIVYNDNKGKKLFKHIQESVKVKGEIMEVAGIKLIKINETERCVLGIPDEIQNCENSAGQHIHSQKRHNN